MKKIKEVERKLFENKNKQRIYGELMKFYEKRNVIYWQIAQRKLESLRKTCGKLVEKYEKLLQSNKQSYSQTHLDI